MTRIPLVLPALALGVAAAFVVPSLTGGIEGEPLRVTASPSAPDVQLADFEGEGCATALAQRDADAPAIRIVAVTLGTDGERTTVTLDEVAPDAVDAGTTLVLLLDLEGRLIAAGDPSAIATGSARATLATDCREAEQVHGAI